MAEHFDADEFALGATDVLFFNLSVDVGHLFHIQFARQHDHIGKACVEFQGIDVRDIELRGEVNLYTHLVAVGHHGYVAGDNGTDSSLFGGIDNLVHRTEVFAIDDGIDRQIALDVMFGARGGNLPQVVDGEMIGRMRPHVELTDAEINRVGTGLDGCRQTFARAYGRHDFKLCDILLHILFNIDSFKHSFDRATSPLNIRACVQK